ncbi:MAG: threonine--tRNA ligase [Candidatus Aenigmarchaeota archaeon]|nr:threonine--tRNA ligase [Candidatus Aenigmarchaeota archaeon]
MRILQTHVDFIEYEPTEKEIKDAEEVEKKKYRYDDVVVLFTSVEEGDNDAVAKTAIDDVKTFLGKVKCNEIILYPFAHLSRDLAPPSDALKIIKEMESHAKGLKIKVHRAPFGWTKAFQMRTKGYPLAETAKIYSKHEKEVETRVEKKEKLTEHGMMARIRKSDFSGLPETDHRVIGEKLDLFSFQEPSPGMVYWHDKGVKLRNILMEFIRAELAKRKYIEISTPALANTVLWRVSGHWDHYKDNMFTTELGNEEFGLKPMNCPSTFLYYKSKKWSYKDFPLRVSDFDQLYRNELSGVASGLFRVKVLTQDDAHTFVTEDQTESEMSEQVEIMKKMYDVFGLKYNVKISTMPDDHIGTKGQWDKAVDILKKVVKKNGLKAEVKEKEGAFYGPKIDVDIKDSMGREWQCSTIQLDFQMPQRFQLTYTGEDGKEHTPIVIHRVIYGSFERFIGILIEHYQGKFPVWLAPVQAIVVSISDQNEKYAKTIEKELLENGIRVVSDYEANTIGYKIRNAQLQKIPYSIVIGKKEEDAKTISVRSNYDGKEKQGVKIENFVKQIKDEIKNFN